jgi:hypothetical protein
MFSWTRVNWKSQTPMWAANQLLTVVIALLCISVRIWQLGSQWTDFFKMKFDMWVFLENLCTKFKFHWNLTRVTGTLHVYQYTFMRVFRWILRLRNVADKSCGEIKNYFIFHNFFRKSCRLWDNAEKCGRAGQATHDHVAHAYFTLGT